MADPQDSCPDLQDGRRVTHWPDDRALLKRAAEVQAQGEKYHEVMGKELHCSPRTLKNRVAKARRRLARAAEEAAKLRATYGLTVNGLSDMAHETATANGWHDLKDGVLDHRHPIAHLAAATMVLGPWLTMFEATRRPGALSPGQPDRLWVFERAVCALSQDGLANQAGQLLSALGETGAPVQGSRTQLIAWMGLSISELMEAVEAILLRDKENFAEELADVMIRLGDNQAAINAMPGHLMAPIDLEAAILAKNARNKKRGYHHGGKLA